MATPPLLIPNLALNSIGLVQLVGLWVSSMGSGEVLPDLPAYAGVCEVVWSYPITLHMLECTWSGPTRSPDISNLWARHIRSASLLLPSPLLGSYDPTWVWAADDAKAFI